MTPSLKRVSIIAAVAIPALGFTLLPAMAQPGGGDGKPPAAHPGEGGPGAGGDRPGRGPGGGERGQRGGPRSPWAEKYQQELREHPSMARSLVALHDTKDYMEKSTEDFGGTKAQTLKDIDAAIKSIEASMKHDPKREPPAGGESPGGRGRGPGGGRGGEGGGGGGGGGGGPEGGRPEKK
jgi:hypothetical protein